MTQLSIDEILELELESFHAGKISLREYLLVMAAEAWRGEFSDKYGFEGDSGWRHTIYKPLVQAGVIRGSYDKDGYVDDIDTAAADLIVLQAIEEIGRRSERP